ncbi:hypothetical protein [uncultured Mucilaginibacter sp.]|uniref:hypothetical protein n=1 Tax=uncultured Mucilaginibacter sp. TaxID=797541 RepID=UPI0025E918C4|nr:hypothetical protein [uncultured Mucilaginibacter sp.]
MNTTHTPKNLPTTAAGWYDLMIKDEMPPEKLIQLIMDYEYQRGYDAGYDDNDNGNCSWNYYGCS